MKRVDLNCDAGEETRGGSEVTPSEAKLLEVVSSVNIACGFHAGDYRAMAALVAAASSAGVRIGAHPGLADHVGFGRRAMELSRVDVYQLVLYQIGALSAIAQAAGAQVTQIKPHGELYHMAQRDYAVAEAVVHAAMEVLPSCTLIGFSGGTLVRTAQQLGMRAAHEVFADRNYMPDATLVSRDWPNALIHDSPAAVASILQMLRAGQIVAVDGSIIENVTVDTICVHADTPGSVHIAHDLAFALKTDGYQIAPFGAT